MPLTEDAVRYFTSMSVPLFVVSSMLSMGFSVRLSQIFLAGADYRIVLGAFVANFVVVPAIAVALGQLIPVNRAVTAGLLLAATASGSPTMPKLVQLARGHIALATGLVLMLMGATILFLPVTLPLLLGDNVTGNQWDLARPLIFYMLVPLGFGLLVRRRLPQVSGALRPITNTVANLAFVVAIARLVIINAEGVGRALRTGVFPTALLFLVGCFLAGYLLTGRNVAYRLVGGLATAQRDISAALLLATTNFASQPDVSVMVVLVGLTGLVGLMGVSVAFRVFAATEPETPRVPVVNGGHWKSK
jgi:predicted Na+-dependent transporter